MLLHVTPLFCQLKNTGKKERRRRRRVNYKLRGKERRKMRCFLDITARKILKAFLLPVPVTSLEDVSRGFSEYVVDIAYAIEMSSTGAVQE